MKGKLDTSRATKVTNLVPSAVSLLWLSAGKTSGCCLNASCTTCCRSFWKCFGLLTRFYKWKDVKNTPPNTMLRQISRESRTCTKDGELLAMQVYTYSTFSWFYPTRPLLQWVILVTLLEWLTEVRSASAHALVEVQGVFCKAIKLVKAWRQVGETCAQQLLRYFWKFPFTGSTIRWSHREFPYGLP